ncbi:MAG: hypothetical protein LBI48_09335 [Burkholderiaceae bacterium]|jgi:hypothetical protein|nr:hypothetical protein [Burkholderiaceae bacterium]
MESTRQSWWHKWFGYSIVEQDGTLYLSMTWSQTYIKSYIILLIVIFLQAGVRFFDSSRHMPLNDVLWYWAAGVSLVILLSLLLIRIERRRFPFGRPLVRVDQDTLTLELNGYVWPTRIKEPLSTLRGVTIMLPPPSKFWPQPCSICLAFSDGLEKTVKPLYLPQVGAAVSDFLQRKLSPYATFTVFGRGALENA